MTVVPKSTRQSQTNFDLPIDGCMTTLLPSAWVDLDETTARAMGMLWWSPSRTNASTPYSWSKCSGNARQRPSKPVEAGPVPTPRRRPPNAANQAVWSG
ncbi:uncharacterized protein UV8b_01164 [Ustilaginoidea virens]|uniref:Uncharacterized protein n=1 Tax=Ustilaginoidea virens TaxID=1159556 RepID=A0A8E5ME44_USTVR|nr:uncharacterized protein UV8b_01164 [Ustilaginoidea virens]QUC16923.1 hypothetical protein UV8b_01164 [Ustilaginoidea virens]